MSARVDEIMKMVLVLRVDEFIDLCRRLHLDPPDDSAREPRRPLPQGGSGSTTIDFSSEQTLMAGWPYSPSATQWLEVEETT